MTAKQYVFIPTKIEVPRGTHVILEVTAEDVTHGLSIPEYDIDVSLPPGETVTVEFYADKPGTYGFHCSHFCGLGHIGMRGTLEVAE